MLRTNEMIFAGRMTAPSSARSEMRTNSVAFLNQILIQTFGT